MLPKNWKDFFRFILPLVLGSMAIFLVLSLLLFIKFQLFFNGVHPGWIFLGILFAHLAAATIPLILFYTQLKKVNEYTDRAIEGKLTHVPVNLSEPFQDIVSGAREMAISLEEKSQMAQESRDRILATLESMAEGVMMVDAEGKNIFVNSALSDSIGFKKEQAIGAYYWETFRDPGVNEMIATCLRARQTLKKEHTVLLSTLVFEIQVSPVLSGNDFLGIVAVFHDVTRLKELERVRTEFVANVSHELKTPLTSILGFVETLKDGAVDDKENRGKFLQIIEDQSRNLHSLIEDLLFLSKIESHAEVVRRQNVDLETLIQKTLKFFDFQIRDKKIKLELEFSKKPFFLEADPGLLERALSNLIDNAIKYNVPNGNIGIFVSEKSGQTLVQVRDTGLGIAEQDLPRIFERFYRADKSRSRETGGTGLGLSIAKHIVERHGGRVEVSSAPQKGSVFSLYLP